MIIVDGVSKIFGNGDSAVRALDNVSLSIGSNNLVAVVGTSGSGKSTLLHILSGLEKATSGSVFYNEICLDHMTVSQLAKIRRKNFGFIFQFFNLIPILSVEENIIMPLLIDGKKPNMSYINTLADILGIKNKLKTFPAKLSGGQQQRVAIARALCAKPTTIFADEPTGNLDSKTGSDIVNLLKDMQKEFRQTCIIVTHDHHIAQQCQSVIEMSDGKIMSEINAGTI